MAEGGVRLTPFDTNDLGSQLLQALVQGEQTKQGRQALKLREKEMDLQSKSDESNRLLQALAFLSPQSRVGPLQEMFPGMSIAPYESPAESQEAERVKRIAALSPKEKSMYDRIQAFGTPLSEEDILTSARFAAGLDLSPLQRTNTLLNLLDQFGSPIAGAFNEFLKTSKVPVQIPSGTQTLAEKGVGIAGKRADADVAEADARRKQAELAVTDFITSGFLPANKDVTPEQFTAAMGEVIDTLRPVGDPKRRLFISPEAATRITPASRAAALAKLGGTTSDSLKAKIDAINALSTGFKAIEKADTDDADAARQQLVDQLQVQTQLLMDELYPPSTDGAEVPMEEKVSAVRSLFPDDIAQILIGSLPPFREAGLMERGMGSLFRHAKEAAKPPSAPATNPPAPTKAERRQIVKTLGPLGNLPDSANKKQFQKLISDYLAKGAKSQLAQEMEQTFADVLQFGSPEELAEVIEAAQEEIRDFNPKVDNNE